MVYNKQVSLLEGSVYDGLSGLCGVNSLQHFPVTFKSLIFTCSLFQTWSLLHFSSPLKNYPKSSPKDSTLTYAFLDGTKL